MGQGSSSSSSSASCRAADVAAWGSSTQQQQKRQRCQVVSRDHPGGLFRLVPVIINFAFPEFDLGVAWWRVRCAVSKSAIEVHRV